MAVEADKPAGAPRVRGRFDAAAGNRVDATRQRPRRGLTWPLRGLLAASLAVPLLLLAIAAWQNYRLLQAQAEERVVIEAGALHAHALEAFDTYALVLDWIDDRIRGLDWQQIGHDEGLHRFLSTLEKLPEIDIVWITDAAGRDRASGRFALMPPIDVSDRDYFVAEKHRDVGIFVGQTHIGRHTHAPEFSISRRRSTPDGGFDGIIRVSAKPGYFSDFYKTVSRAKDFSAALLRSDGAVLARYPTLPPPLVLPRHGPFMQAIAANPEGGLFWGRGEIDGVRRFYGYRRIDGYPVYVLFGIAARGVLAAWRANLVSYSLFAVPASLALFGLTLVAVGQIQRHKIGSWRWQLTARRLKREMDRRSLAEAELRQAQKMEALGQLTGGVAHDFNNLLTVLQGCLELLSGHQRDQRSQARVDMALRTIARGENLTRQLLAFARRQPLAVTIVDLNAQLRRMAELLARTVGSGINLETDLAPDLWPVEADATQLELAVINLAINARDAMPDGGRLRIRTANRPSPDAAADARAFVGLEISDTGAGMPADVLARAFEPFFTTKGPGKGTGLGLSMVYGFAHQSGGTATIRSEPGRGTTVTLDLPRCGGPGASAEATGLPPGGPA